jgi:histamine receptor H1
MSWSNNRSGASEDPLGNFSVSMTQPNFVENMAFWLLLPTAICSTMFNLLVILAFVSEKTLWTPFNFYLCNLAVSDMLMGCLDTVFAFINNLNSGHWRLGRALCHFWSYIDWVVSMSIANSLMFISFDRLWAVRYPISYHQHCSRKLSLWAIGGLWFAIHGFVLPGLIMERRETVDGGDRCNLQNSPKYEAWTTTCQIVGYYLPNVCVIGAYVAIGARLSRRRNPAGMSGRSFVSRNVVIPTQPMQGDSSLNFSFQFARRRKFQ